MQPKPLPGRGPLAGPSFQPLPVSAKTEPGKATVNPIAKARPAAQPAAGGELRLQSSNQYLRTPIVRYSSRMRVGKLHAMRITLMGADGKKEAVKPQTLSGGFDPPIVLQVTAPGALVTPNHMVIPISGGSADFVIQPLKSGKLKGAKVEFLSQGRMVSDIPLTMKANRGYLAKFLLLLGLLLPLVINFFPDLVFVDHNTPANVTYQNEEAIGAWVRSNLHKNGYQTKVIVRNPDVHEGILNVSRRIEITEDSQADWSTKRVLALGLYYCEPILRFLYRTCIELPRTFAFGDLIFAAVLLGIGAIVWILTGANRRKLKGGVMDIRLAGNLSAT